MTNDEIVELMEQAGPLLRTPFAQWCVKFAKLVAAKEREACALEFDRRDIGIGFYEPHEPAEIIRALGNEQVEAIHIPKGSMCMACANASVECANLQFHAMPVIEVYDNGVRAVKCAAFAQKSKEAK